MLRVFRPLFYVFAALLFVAASVLSTEATVAPNGPPNARDVDAARGLGRQAVSVLRRPGGGPVIVQTDHLDGIARTLAYAKPGLRTAIRRGRDTMTLDVSLQLAPRTFLNGSLTGAASDADSPPRFYASIGRYTFGPPAVDWLGRLVIRWLWTGEGDPVRPSGIVKTLRIEEPYILGAIEVPRPLLAGLQRQFGDYSPEAARSAEATYARLSQETKRTAGSPPVILEDFAREAFAPAETAGRLSPEEAKGRLVGMLMAGYSPEFMRLADAAMTGKDRGRPEARQVVLAGRRDLPLHFLFSAVIASRSGYHAATAIGEYKELSDSLPGGSGFSFVDLAADRAGTRLGRLLSDPATTARTQRLLAKARPGEIFPAAALGFEENLSETDFEERFGKLDSKQYAAAVKRIDAALAALPIYAAGR